MPDLAEPAATKKNPERCRAQGVASNESSVWDLTGVVVTGRRGVGGNRELPGLLFFFKNPNDSL
jgi:hypothetical protein